MNSIDVTLVKSFTNNGKGGNSAGVVFNADNLTDEQKLKIAQTVGYSETAFVSNDDEADYEVSFFTTSGEVDFCGHATVATFATLYQKGVIGVGNYVQRTKAGMLSVKIKSNGQIVMEQRLPQKLARISNQDMSDILGIELELLESTNLPIEVISTGLPDAIIPVPKGCLDKIKPNDKLISGFCKKHNLVGFHVFELNDSESEITASCRNFAPLFGISEESATGTSNGALACYLAEHLDLGTDFVFEQGRAMNCTSKITAAVQLQEENVIKVEVGGFASSIGTLTVSLS